MGRASKDDTVARIYQAFLAQRTWRQAELARFVGVSTRALRQRLDELCARGMPLESDPDPPDVFWSIPKSWFPGGIMFSADEAGELLRELWLLPPSRRKDKAISKLLRGLPHSEHAELAAAAFVPMAVSPVESIQREVLEDALLQRSALRIRYFSASRGALEWRHISPVRLVAGPPLRLLACCHRTTQLRWFRVDGVVEAELDPSQLLRSVATEAVERFIAESVNGYHDHSPVVEHVFVVRAPEARWVSKNLAAPMTAEPTPTGIRVTAKTAGALPVARFVVSLGSAARAETSPLREIVRELAKGALSSLATGPVKTHRQQASLNRHRVRSIRSSR